MGLNINTSTNAQDNSIRQMNENANNSLQITGGLGGDSSQSSDLNTTGNLGLTLPGMKLQNLDTYYVQLSPELQQRGNEIADNAKQYYGDVKQHYKDASQEAKQFYQDASQDAKQFYSQARDEAKQFGNDVKVVYKDARDIVREQAKDTYNNVAGQFRDFVDQYRQPQLQNLITWDKAKELYGQKDQIAKDVKDAGKVV